MRDAAIKAIANLIDLLSSKHEGICTFFISGTKCEEIKHERSVICCSLRGNVRKMVKEQLQYVPPRTLQREITKRTDPELVQEGHMQELRLLSTYQKAKSEHIIVEMTEYLVQAISPICFSN